MEKISGTIPVFFSKEKESFVAYSPAMDLSTCGQTIEEARRNFLKRLRSFLKNAQG